MQEPIITTADLLEETGPYIAEHGWVQDAMITLDGRVCAVGGMVGALGEDAFTFSERVHDERVQAAAQALVTHLGLDWFGDRHEALQHGPQCMCLINAVTSWNDNENRTQQEVLDGLAKAAKIERNGGIDPDA